MHKKIPDNVLKALRYLKPVFRNHLPLNILSTLKKSKSDVSLSSIVEGMFCLAKRDLTEFPE